MSSDDLPDDIRQLSADLLRLKPSDNTIRSDELFYQAGFAAAQNATARVAVKPKRTLLYAGLSAVVAACLTAIATAPISYRAGESDALTSLSETNIKPQQADDPSGNTPNALESKIESMPDTVVAETKSPASSYLQLFVNSVSNRKPPTTLTAYHGAKWLNEDLTYADQSASLSAIENSSRQFVMETDKNVLIPFAVRDAFIAFPSE